MIIGTNVSSLLEQTTIEGLQSQQKSIADDILVMKEGQILAHNTQSALLSSMEQKVWEVQLDRCLAKELLDTCIVVHTQQKTNHQILLRIVQDTRPHPLAQHVKPTLDDYYLYHFAGNLEPAARGSGDSSRT